MAEGQRTEIPPNHFPASGIPARDGTADSAPPQPLDGTLTGSQYPESPVSPISTQGQRVAPAAGLESRSTPSLVHNRPRDRGPPRSAPGITGQFFGDARPHKSEAEKTRENPSRTKGADTQTIWEAVIDQFKWHDDELINEWQRSMDVLLIFAALFAGILTAFLIEVNRLLKEDLSRTAAILLAQIAQNTGTTNTSALGLSDAVVTLPPFKPTAVAKRVNRLWFASLALTISSAIFAMIAKQWITEYTSGVSSQMSFDPLHTSVERLRDEVRLRQYRINGLGRWKVQDIVGGLPIVLHLGLLIFAIGLIDYEWSLDHGTAIVLLVIVALAFSFYTISAIIPSYDPACPYKTPFTHLITNWHHALVLMFVPKLDFDTDTSIMKRLRSGFRQAAQVHGSLQENEKEEVELHANQLDKDCLHTLKRITRDGDVAAWAEEELEKVINSTPIGRPNA